MPDPIFIVIALVLLGGVLVLFLKGRSQPPLDVEEDEALKPVVDAPARCRKRG